MNFRMEKREAFVVSGMRKNITMDDMQAMPTVWVTEPQQLTGTVNNPEPYVFGNPSQAILDAPYNLVQIPDMRICIIPPGKYAVVSPDGVSGACIVSESIIAATASFDDGTGFACIDFVDQEYGVATYSFGVQDEKISVRVGEATATAKATDTPDEYDTIPAADWAVFSFPTPMTPTSVSEAYTRILTEWFPASGYTRKQDIPHMEKFPLGQDSTKQPWEIWIPVLSS